MNIVTISHARSRLCELVDRAAAGEDIIISRNGKPLVRITALISGKAPVKFGLLKGKLRIPADFDAPQADDLLGRFTGC